VCAEIDNGQAMDVVEIDAASNRGIDEIRNLQEEVRLSPTSYKYKVFIIDEAHMLTTAAFNALLKTLEEPPAHVIFILATTEFEKISPTIASRTQRFAFKRLSKTKVLEKLSAVAKKEQLNIEPAALELAAAAGEGSLRDSESLLDQVISFAVLEGKKISVEDVERIIGKVGLAKIDEFAGLVLRKDAKKSLEYLAHLGNSGYNIPQFTKDFIHYLRRVLALQVNPALEAFFTQELTADELAAHIGVMDSASQARLIRSLIRAYGEIRYSPFATIPLEVALVENFTSH
jgi:DNA polymerase-3 subunit gamma/tau